LHVLRKKVNTLYFRSFIDLIYKSLFKAYFIKYLGTFEMVKSVMFLDLLKRTIFKQIPDMDFIGSEKPNDRIIKVNFEFKFKF
jgi:hypothetical protein